VELGGAIELHAAFREESRTSLPSVSAALQEIRETRILLWSLKTLFGDGRDFP
jgi:hypothetical protein